MKVAFICGLILLSCSAVVSAQSIQPGKYSGSTTAPGSYSGSSSGIQVQITIEIASADNGILKGTIQNPRSKKCGLSPRAAEGTYEGSKVNMHALAPGALSDCVVLSFEGAVEGGILVGTMTHDNGITPITLKK